MWFNDKVYILDLRIWFKVKGCVYKLWLSVKVIFKFKFMFEVKVIVYV
jgi:hypothetical protein